MYVNADKTPLLLHYLAYDVQCFTYYALMTFRTRSQAVARIADRTATQ